jgi:hypothetical protein
VPSRCDNGACRACRATACCGHFRKRPQHTYLVVIVAFESPNASGPPTTSSIRSAVQCTSVQCQHPQPRLVAYSTWGRRVPIPAEHWHWQWDSEWPGPRDHWACVLSGNLSHDPDSKQQSPPMATSATDSQGPTSVSNMRNLNLKPSPVTPHGGQPGCST